MYIAQKTDKFIKSYNNIKYKTGNDVMYVNVYIFETKTGTAIMDITKWNGANHNTVKLLYMTKEETNNFVMNFKKEGFINGVGL